MTHPVGKRNTTTHTGTERGSHYTSIYHVIHDDPAWKNTISTPSALLSRGFGRPDKAHSCTQVASFETTLIIFLKYGDGYLTRHDLQNLLSQHTLVRHMYRMIPVMANYDFTWIRQIDSTWASQTALRKDKLKAFTAALYHYNFNVSFLMRMLGNNYTGEHRNIQYIVERVRPHIEPYLLPHLIRVLQTGTPAHMVAETTRDNAMKYWRQGNNPSINNHIDTTTATMVKEERNNYVIPLHGHLFRFVPHLMLNPHTCSSNKGRHAKLQI